MDRRSTTTLIIIAVAAIAVATIIFALRDETSIETAPPISQVIEETPSSIPEPTDSSTAPSSTAAETTTTTTISAPPPTLAPGETACSPYQSITTAGVVASPELVEASGLAGSRTQPGVLWAHNDSRDGARAYAIGPDGADLGGFDIAGALAFDWEDMAAGPGSDAGTSHLYFGDIGDNFSIRGGRITIYRVPEPDPRTLSGSIEGTAVLEFIYPDGTYNAEAMFIADDSLYIVTKDTEEARVYRGSATRNDSGVERLEFITALRLGAEVSGADMSWDGTTIALRGYDSVWLWHRQPGATVAETFTTEPCNAPAPEEAQGEALAFLSDLSYATTSEGSNPDLFLVPFDD